MMDIVEFMDGQLIPDIEESVKFSEWAVEFDAGVADQATWDAQGADLLREQIARYRADELNPAERVLLVAGLRALAQRFSWHPDFNPSWVLTH